MLDTSSLDKVWEYIKQLEEWWKQARERVVELVDEKKKLEDENYTLKRKLKNAENDYKILYYDYEQEKMQIRCLLETVKDYAEKLNQCYKDLENRYF